jgi:spermidine/putrescine transport system substrate-binding protein
MSDELRAYARTAMTEGTRRSLLKRAGVTVVTLTAGPWLAGCGSDTVPKERATSAGAQPSIGGKLDFLTWEGYDLRDQTTAWRKANGVQYRSTFIGSHDDIQAKLKSGGDTGTDVITYYQGFSDLYRKLEILHPIDEAAVPNLELLYPLFREGEFADRFWKVDGKRWGIPFTWGTIACNYRADKVDPPTSWKDLLKPEFKGKVGWPDDANGAFILAGHLLGMNPPTFTRAQFDEVLAFLRQMRDQTHGIAPSFGDLTNQLVSGDVLVSFMGWSAVDVWAQDKGADVKSVIPTEGSFSFCDAYAIAPGTDNLETAHAFINEALTPEVQAAQAEALSAGVVTPGAIPQLKGPIKKLYPYDDIDGHFAKSPLYGNAPTEADGDVVTYDELLKAWQGIKAGR